MTQPLFVLKNALQTKLSYKTSPSSTAFIKMPINKRLCQNTLFDTASKTLSYVLTITFYSLLSTP